MDPRSPKRPCAWWRALGCTAEEERWDEAYLDTGKLATLPSLHERVQHGSAGARALQGKFVLFERGAGRGQALLELGALFGGAAQIGDGGGAARLLFLQTRPAHIGASLLLFGLRGQCLNSTRRVLQLCGCVREPVGVQRALGAQCVQALLALVHILPQRNQLLLLLLHLEAQALSALSDAFEDLVTLLLGRCFLNLQCGALLKQRRA